MGAVDVRQKLINGLEALNQTPFQHRPVLAMDQAWQGIERENPFTALEPGTIEAKGGAQAPQQVAGGGMAAVQFRQSHGTERGQQRLEIFAWCGLFTAKIFVVPAGWLVLREHRLNNGSPHQKTRQGAHELPLLHISRPEFQKSSRLVICVSLVT